MHDCNDKYVRTPLNDDQAIDNGYAKNSTDESLKEQYPLKVERS